MIFGTKQEEITKPKPLYKFEYEIGFKSARTGNFYSGGYYDIETAKEVRKELTESLMKSMSDKTIVNFSDCVIIRGEDISWFVIRHPVEIEP